jgi:hypothetical protein
MNLKGSVQFLLSKITTAVSTFWEPMFILSPVDVSSLQVGRGASELLMVSVLVGRTFVC